MTDEKPLFDWAPDLLAFFARSWLVVTLSTTLCLVLAMTYVLVGTPRFSASSTVLLDLQAAEPFKAQNTPIDSQFANGLAESQVEVLESEGLARVVVDRLNLADDATFLRNGATLTNAVLGWLLAPFTSPLPVHPGDRETVAAELLTQMLRVKRAGLSYILDVSVTSRDPVMSARLVNEVVDVFVDYGLAAKGANTRRASQWLQQRIGELQQQATAADAAVQAFKAEAGIVDTDKGLMNERHLGELNSQLVLARARSSDARARIERIRQIMQSGAWNGDVADALSNVVITHLREQYVDAARQAAEWTARVGAGHGVVQQANDRLKDIQVQIQSELKRIADAAESDYQVALANQRDTEGQLAALVTVGDQTNKNLVRLRELQSSADTLKSLRDNFLVRYTQAVQDQSFPISDVQVISKAAVPLRKSWPKPLIVLAAGACLGLAAGFAVALLREALDHGLRTPAQVRGSLGLACLGMLPAIRQRGRRDAQPGGLRRFAVPAMLRQTAIAPFSPYAETIRGLRIRLTHSRDGRRDIGVIGCASALPGEGKSTVAANFAGFLAEAGFRTLLVDADLRRRTLSQTLAPGCAPGMTQVIDGTLPFEAVVWHDAQNRLAFLPASAERGEPGLPSFSAAEVQAMLGRLRNDFDFIVVDLPAILPVADAAAAANAVDGVLLVVEWGRTQEEAIVESIEHAALDRSRLLGVVLNKVKPKYMRHYQVPRRSYAPKPIPA